MGSYPHSPNTSFSMSEMGEGVDRTQVWWLLTITTTTHHHPFMKLEPEKFSLQSPLYFKQYIGRYIRQHRKHNVNHLFPISFGWTHCTGVTGSPLYTVTLAFRLQFTVHCERASPAGSINPQSTFTPSDRQPFTGGYLQPPINCFDACFGGAGCLSGVCPTKRSCVGFSRQKKQRSMRG